MSPIDIKKSQGWFRTNRGHCELCLGKDATDRRLGRHGDLPTLPVTFGAQSTLDQETTTTEYDRSNEDLCAILIVLTESLAFLLVFKLEDETRIGVNYMSW